MKFSRLRLRRLAACTLFLWTVAVAVSMAHACGLGSRVAAAGHGADVMEVRAAVSHVVAAAHGHEQPPVADRVNCVKFCDEDKTSATSLAAVAASTPALVDSWPLPVARDETLAAASLRAALFHDLARRPPRSLPIDLLRLTL